MPVNSGTKAIPTTMPFEPIPRSTLHGRWASRLRWVADGRRDFSSSLFSSVSRADDAAARNVFTSVCQFHGCFNGCIFLFQNFFHVINPRFPLSSSAPHAFNVAMECLSSWLNHVSLLFWILSIIVSSCSSIFLTVSFLTFCSLETLCIFLSNPFLSIGYF